VRSAAELESAYERCRAEALLATGADAVYAEALVERARHIEVQVLGDLNGHLVSLGERDCSIQQHNQKLIEIAPAPAITESQRSALEQAALTLAREVDYDNVGTFEFLLDIDSGRFYFIEANPRLQVEHAVTEMVTGLDLVAAQLQLASGLGLGELGIEPAPRPSGLVLEARINLSPDGDGSGAIEVFQPPHMPGVRFDSFLYSGYTPSLSYDPLLAKIIGYDPGGGLASAAELVLRGLSEMKLTGVGLNVPLLRSLLAELDDAVQSGRLTTGLLGDLLKTTAVPLWPPGKPCSSSRR
jgi:acetyl/propionyl-CoA carboxylase alpha subunit